VPVPLATDGVQRIAKDLLASSAGPFDEFHPHAVVGAQNDGAEGRFGQLELLDDLVEAERLLIPALLGVEVGNGKADVMEADLE
jgi:hypothetical protein